jgi:hypothetical protein
MPPLLGQSKVVTPKEPAMKAALALTSALVFASGAFAEPLTNKAARKALFAVKVASVEMMADSGLPEQDQTVLASVAAQQPYYGAIAISPDEGLLSEATVAAANYHDTAAAESAALADCNAKKTGITPCVIAALIRPDGYEPRDLQLSQDATVAFRKDYPGNGGALAISALTGAWGMGKGTEAAIATCAAKAGATDCMVVVQD